MGRTIAREGPSAHPSGPLRQGLYSSWVGGELFLAAMGAIGCVMTAWVGVLAMAFGVGVGLLCVMPPTTRALGLD
jgi:hypothetical protein